MRKTLKFSLRSCIAGLLVPVFFLTSVWGRDFVFAAALAPAEEASLSSLKDLILPENLGRIEDIFEPSGAAPKIILIQDAHAIPAAQRSIRRLLLHLQKKYGVRQVAVEGAAAKLDPQMFTSFPDKRVLAKVLRGYMDRGELTGSVAAALMGVNPKAGSVSFKPDYFGVEDWQLYEEGLELYLKGMAAQAAALEQINAQAAKLEEAKKQKYSKELLSVDLAEAQFCENQKDLPGFLNALAAVKAPESGSEIALFLAETAKEGTGQEELENEVRKVAEDFKSMLESVSPESRRLFNEQQQAFQTGEIHAEQFALTLKEIAAREKIEIPMSPALLRGAQNQKRLRDIEGTQFYKTLKVFTQSVKASLFTNDEMRRLDRETHELLLFKKLAKLELSRDEWNEIKAISGKREAASDSFAAGRSTLSASLAFYENAEQRDHVFFEKLKARAKPGETLVMIAGGFHAQGLMECFKSAGIAYALVMPRIEHLPETSNYRAHMQGDVSWKNYFKVENGRVNLYEPFVRYTRDQLIAFSVERPADRNGDSPLNASRSTLKLWRDQLIRDLSRAGRIEKAGDYTRFLDEKSDKSAPGMQAGLQRLEMFFDGLRKLDREGRFQAPNILQLLKSGSSPLGATVPSGPDSAGVLTGASLSLLAMSSPIRAATSARKAVPSSARSEMRLDGSAVAVVPVAARKSIVQTMSTEAADKNRAEIIKGITSILGRELKDKNGVTFKIGLPEGVLPDTLENTQDVTLRLVHATTQMDVTFTVLPNLIQFPDLSREYADPVKKAMLMRLMLEFSAKIQVPNGDLYMESVIQDRPTLLALARQMQRNLARILPGETLAEVRGDESAETLARLLGEYIRLPQAAGGTEIDLEGLLDPAAINETAAGQMHENFGLQHSLERIEIEGQPAITLVTRQLNSRFVLHQLKGVLGTLTGLFTESIESRSGKNLRQEAGGFFEKAPAFYKELAQLENFRAQKSIRESMDLVREIYEAFSTPQIDQTLANLNGKIPEADVESLRNTALFIQEASADWLGLKDDFFHEVTLDAFLKKAARLVAPEGEGLVQFELNPAQKKTRVEILPNTLIEILINLTRNAREAIQQLQKDLGAEADYTPKITVSIQPGPEGNKSSFRIIVSDNGPGMTAEQTAKANDGMSFTSPKPGSMGIGLSSTHRLVKDIFHGEFNVVSKLAANGQPGETVITMTLPTSQPKRSEMRADANASAPQNASLSDAAKQGLPRRAALRPASAKAAAGRSEMRTSTEDEVNEVIEGADFLFYQLEQELEELKKLKATYDELFRDAEDLRNANAWRTQAVESMRSGFDTLDAEDREWLGLPADWNEIDELLLRLSRAELPHKIALAQMTLEGEFAAVAALKSDSARPLQDKINILKLNNPWKRRMVWPLILPPSSRTSVSGFYAALEKITEVPVIPEIGWLAVPDDVEDRFVQIASRDADALGLTGAAAADYRFNEIRILKLDYLIQQEAKTIMTGHSSFDGHRYQIAFDLFTEPVDQEDGGFQLTLFSTRFDQTVVTPGPFQLVPAPHPLIDKLKRLKIARVHIDPDLFTQWKDVGIGSILRGLTQLPDDMSLSTGTSFRHPSAIGPPIFWAVEDNSDNPYLEGYKTITLKFTAQSEMRTSAVDRTVTMGSGRQVFEAGTALLLQFGSKNNAFRLARHSDGRYHIRSVLAGSPDIVIDSTMPVGRLAPVLVLRDDTGSRRHAEISLEDGGETLRLEDLGSSNGTTVDGVAIRNYAFTIPAIAPFVKRNPHYIQNADELRHLKHLMNEGWHFTLEVDKTGTAVSQGPLMRIENRIVLTDGTPLWEIVLRLHEERDTYSKDYEHSILVDPGKLSVPGQEAEPHMGITLRILEAARAEMRNPFRDIKASTINRILIAGVVGILLLGGAVAAVRFYARHELTQFEKTRRDLSLTREESREKENKLAQKARSSPLVRNALRFEFGQKLKSTDPKVISDTLSEIGAAQDRELVSEILPFLRHASDDVRWSAAVALGKMFRDSKDSDLEVQRALVAALKDAHYLVSGAAADTLRDILPQEPDADIVRAIGAAREQEQRGLTPEVSPSVDVLVFLAEKNPRKDIVEQLASVRSDKNERVREAAAQALASLAQGPEKAAPREVGDSRSLYELRLKGRLIAAGLQGSDVKAWIESSRNKTLSDRDAKLLEAVAEKAGNQRDRFSAALEEIPEDMTDTLKGKSAEDVLKILSSPPARSEMRLPRRADTIWVSPVARSEMRNEEFKAHFDHFADRVEELLGDKAWYMKPLSRTAKPSQKLYDESWNTLRSILVPLKAGRDRIIDLARQLGEQAVDEPGLIAQNSYSNLLGVFIQHYRRIGGAVLGFSDFIKGGKGRVPPPFINALNVYFIYGMAAHKSLSSNLPSFEMSQALQPKSPADFERRTGQPGALVQIAEFDTGQAKFQQTWFDALSSNLVLLRQAYSHSPELNQTVGKVYDDLLRQWDGLKSRNAEYENDVTEAFQADFLTFFHFLSAAMFVSSHPDLAWYSPSGLPEPETIYREQAKIAQQTKVFFDELAPGQIDVLEYLGLDAQGKPRSEVRRVVGRTTRLPGARPQARAEMRMTAETGVAPLPWVEINEHLRIMNATLVKFLRTVEAVASSPQLTEVLGFSDEQSQTIFLKLFQAQSNEIYKHTRIYLGTLGPDHPFVKQIVVAPKLAALFIQRLPEGERESFRANYEAWIQQEEGGLAQLLSDHLLFGGIVLSDVILQRPETFQKILPHEYFHRMTDIRMPFSERVEMWQGYLAVLNDPYSRDLLLRIFPAEAGRYHDELMADIPRIEELSSITAKAELLLAMRHSFFSEFWAQVTHPHHAVERAPAFKELVEFIRLKANTDSKMDEALSRQEWARQQADESATAALSSIQQQFNLAQELYALSGTDFSRSEMRTATAVSALKAGLKAQWRNVTAEFTEEGGALWFLTQFPKTRFTVTGKFALWQKMRETRSQVRDAFPEHPRDFGFEFIFKAAYDMESLQSFLDLGLRLLKEEQASPRLMFRNGIPNVLTLEVAHDFQILSLGKKQERLNALLDLFGQLDRALAASPSQNARRFTFEPAAADVYGLSAEVTLEDMSHTSGKFVWNDFLRWGLIFKELRGNKFSVEVKDASAIQLEERPGDEADEASRQWRDWDGPELLQEFLEAPDYRSKPRSEMRTDKKEKLTWRERVARWLDRPAQLAPPATAKDFFNEERRNQIKTVVILGDPYGLSWGLIRYFPFLDMQKFFPGANFIVTSDLLKMMNFKEGTRFIRERDLDGELKGADLKNTLVIDATLASSASRASKLLGRHRHIQLETYKNALVLSVGERRISSLHSTRPGDQNPFYAAQAAMLRNMGFPIPTGSIPVLDDVYLSPAVKSGRVRFEMVLRKKLGLPYSGTLNQPIIFFNPIFGEGNFVLSESAWVDAAERIAERFPQAVLLMHPGHTDEYRRLSGSLAKQIRQRFSERAAPLQTPVLELTPEDHYDMDVMGLAAVLSTPQVIPVTVNSGTDHLADAMDRPRITFADGAKEFNRDYGLGRENSRAFELAKDDPEVWLGELAGIIAHSAAAPKSEVRRISVFRRFVTSGLLAAAFWGQGASLLKAQEPTPVGEGFTVVSARPAAEKTEKEAPSVLDAMSPEEQAALSALPGPWTPIPSGTVSAAAPSAAPKFADYLLPNPVTLAPPGSARVGMPLFDVELPSSVYNVTTQKFGGFSGLLSDLLFYKPGMSWDVSKGELPPRFILKLPPEWPVAVTGKTADGDAFPSYLLIIPKIQNAGTPAEFTWLLADNVEGVDAREVRPFHVEQRLWQGVGFMRAEADPKQWPLYPLYLPNALLMLTIGAAGFAALFMVDRFRNRLTFSEEPAESEPGTVIGQRAAAFLAARRAEMRPASAKAAAGRSEMRTELSEDAASGYALAYKANVIMMTGQGLGFENHIVRNQATLGERDTAVLLGILREENTIGGFNEFIPEISRSLQGADLKGKSSEWILARLFQRYEPLADAEVERWGLKILNSLDTDGAVLGFTSKNRFESSITRFSEDALFSSADGQDHEITVSTVGPLVFVVADSLNPVTLQNLKEKLRDEIKEHPHNIIFTEKAVYNTRQIDMGFYTTHVIAAMLKNAEAFRGAVVADFGAGHGILSQVALTLGAAHVMLADYEHLTHAAEILSGQGYARDDTAEPARGSFSLHTLDFTDAKGKRRLREFAKQIDIALVNIGPWEQYLPPGAAAGPNYAVIKSLSSAQANWRLLLNSGYHALKTDHVRELNKFYDFFWRRGDTVETLFHSSSSNKSNILQVVRAGQPVPRSRSEMRLQLEQVADGLTQYVYGKVTDEILVEVSGRLEQVRENVSVEQIIDIQREIVVRKLESIQKNKIRRQDKSLLLDIVSDNLAADFKNLNGGFAVGVTLGPEDGKALAMHLIAAIRQLRDAGAVKHALIAGTPAQRREISEESGTADLAPGALELLSNLNRVRAHELDQAKLPNAVRPSSHAQNNELLVPVELLEDQSGLSVADLEMLEAVSVFMQLAAGAVIARESRLGSRPDEIRGKLNQLLQVKGAEIDQDVLNAVFREKGQGFSLSQKGLLGILQVLETQYDAITAMRAAA